MRESKSTLLLLVPVFLLLLSLGLLFKWGYQLSRNQDAPLKIIETAKQVQDGAAGFLQDSLQKIYAATVVKLDSNLDSALNSTSNLSSNLDIKLSEFNKLKNEITGLLKYPGNNEDLIMARKKIAELQIRVDMLNRHYKEVEEENKRFNALVTQLTEEIRSSAQNTKPVVTETKPVTESKVIPAAIPTAEKNAVVNFSVSDIRLSALMIDDEKEIETSTAGLADKLAGSFTVKNNTNFSNAELAVVVTGPDGQILKNSEWETGTFETREGRKIYSFKTRFEYSRGEARKVNFSLNAENLSRGNYIMQVYHNGNLIGRIQKPLS
jgi:hypothetical protein